MQRELIDLFKALPNRSEWVFIRADGTPYQQWDIYKPFQKLLASLGIDATQYSWKELRHTTGTLLHLKGADPLAIKDQLRHTTVKTTEDFYIGSDVEYQRQQNEKLVLPQATA
jgi:integrase